MIVQSVYNLVILLSIFGTAITVQKASAKQYVSFLLGKPLSGKGTQASLLVSEFGLVHLSAGDLLRAERERGTELANKIESYITQGAIVPVSITLRLIRQAMESSGASRFLIDGFPRNNDNLEGWNRDMSDIVLDKVIFIDCPEGELELRMVKRAERERRSDDNAGKRFISFN